MYPAMVDEKNEEHILCYIYKRRNKENDIETK